MLKPMAQHTIWKANSTMHSVLSERGPATRKQINCRFQRMATVTVGHSECGVTHGSKINRHFRRLANANIGNEGVGRRKPITCHQKSEVDQVQVLGLAFEKLRLHVVPREAMPRAWYDSNELWDRVDEIDELRDEE